METIIDKDLRLFVFRGPEYTTQLGFGVVYGYCMEMARRIVRLGFLPEGTHLAPVLEAEIGTAAQYQQYLDFLEIVGDRKMGTWFSYNTPNAVRKTIEGYRKSGGKIRLFYGDKNTGRCWMEENDVLGRVGRSTGKMQIPLLIPDKEPGGSAILDDCIVRIMDVESRSEVYRHKLYHLPKLEIRPLEQGTRDGYSHGVWRHENDGTVINIANFKTMGKAAQYIAFMSGDCLEQPE